MSKALPQRRILQLFTQLPIQHPDDLRGSPRTQAAVWSARFRKKHTSGVGAGGLCRFVTDSLPFGAPPAKPANAAPPQKSRKPRHFERRVSADLGQRLVSARTIFLGSAE